MGYFKLQEKRACFQIGAFPNWVYLGEGDLTYYGLPEFGYEGIKIGREITTGPAEEPDSSQQHLGNPLQVAAMTAWVREHFAFPIERLVRSETCFYAHAPQSSFVLDLHPLDSRIAIGSACSGHGFKFAPLTGRILSELALFGKTTIPKFEEFRDCFTASTAIRSLALLTR